ncbi:40S ribosomal protein S15 [Astathelohania contejeani]|uniref:40S ribosomal protein S15 n=1 Tax=Astathelohania contejeani TaxID=164912 RepID=A0ABQ7I298_9MICR|nr:40S ribosomal protein S15 [Thelohania contejeani]
MTIKELIPLFSARVRRRIRRGFSEREVKFLFECAEAKKKVAGHHDKPAVVNTMARSMVVLPQLVGNIVGIHTGRGYMPVEIKPEMIGLRFSDLAPTRIHPSHGRPGVGATSSSKFVPLK